MKTLEEKITALSNFSRSGTRSKASVEAEVMKEMDTFVGTKAQLLEKEQELKRKVQDIFQQERSNHNKEVNLLWIEVQKEVTTEEGLDFDHRKVKQAWNIAWDEGHSGGYGDVVNYFRTICELLKE